MMVGSWNRYAAKGAELILATEDHKPGAEKMRVEIDGVAVCRHPNRTEEDDDAAGVVDADEWKVYLPGTLHSYTYSGYFRVTDFLYEELSLRGLSL